MLLLFLQFQFYYCCILSLLLSISTPLWSIKELNRFCPSLFQERIMSEIRCKSLKVYFCILLILDWCKESSWSHWIIWPTQNVDTEAWSCLGLLCDLGHNYAWPNCQNWQLNMQLKWCAWSKLLNGGVKRKKTTFIKEFLSRKRKHCILFLKFTT